MKANPAALKVAELTQRLVGGYYAHAAAIEVARDPRVKTPLSAIPPDQIVPVGFVPRKDGTNYPYHFHHFLDQVRTNSEIGDDLQRTWLAGSLLTRSATRAEWRCCSNLQVAYVPSKRPRTMMVKAQGFRGCPVKET
jgi:hypothetical protein